MYVQPTKEMSMEKLSDDLQQIDESGDAGGMPEGYPERAKEIEDLLQMCIKDIYSQSGTIKKTTVLAVHKYVHFNGIEI